MLQKISNVVLIFAFLGNSLVLPSAYAKPPVLRADRSGGGLSLPAPGTRVSLSPAFNPPVLKGIKVNPNDPFRFEFILDKGDSNLDEQAIKDESSRLIKYFLASLTVPEKDLWVNLSPYEKDRIIPGAFGLTEMGRDLLAQDYILKQVTASLIYPEEGIGKEFWKRVYAEAARKYHTTDIPVNTFNKVWIVPEKAIVYENAGSAIAYVVESQLKVMLEEDYLALKKSGKSANSNSLGSQIVREIVIPALTKEVNEGANFAKLRQVYNSLILATWYKTKIKNSILNKVYADRNKIVGIDIDPGQKQKIYRQYLQAFKKGVYNYIKEDPDPTNVGSGATVPRKYFSGGITDLATNIQIEAPGDRAMLSFLTPFSNRLKVVVAQFNPWSDASPNPIAKSSSIIWKVEGRYEFDIRPDSSIDELSAISSRATADLEAQVLHDSTARYLSDLGILYWTDRIVSPYDLGDYIWIKEFINNSVDAIADVADHQGKSYKGTIILRMMKGSKGESVIELEDNGTGIRRRYLRRMFGGGFWAFTTKQTLFRDPKRQGGEGKGTLYYGFGILSRHEGILEVETYHKDTGAHQLIMEHTTDKVEAVHRIRPSDRKNIGTTIRWIFPSKDNSQEIEPVDGAMLGSEIFNSEAGALRYLLNQGDGGSFEERMHRMVNEGRIVDGEGGPLSWRKAVGFKMGAQVLDKVFQGGSQDTSDLKKMVPEFKGAKTETAIWGHLLGQVRKPDDLHWTDMARIYEIVWGLPRHISRQAFLHTGSVVDHLFATRQYDMDTLKELVPEAHDAKTEAGIWVHLLRKTQLKGFRWNEIAQIYEILWGLPPGVKQQIFERTGSVIDHLGDAPQKGRQGDHASSYVANFGIQIRKLLEKRYFDSLDGGPARKETAVARLLELTLADQLPKTQTGGPKRYDEQGQLLTGLAPLTLLAYLPGIGYDLIVPMIHQWNRDREHASDAAMMGIENTGGIDFNADKMNLQVQNAGAGITFHIDPGMLEELQNAEGFVPVIISVQPFEIKSFLAI